jgi:hypothetical protein
MRPPGADDPPPNGTGSTQLVSAEAPRYGWSERISANGHIATMGGLAELAAPIGAAGLVVGRDKNGQPVVIRLFREEPTSVALVGGWWATQLFVFRALALGARITVNTTSPQRWHDFARASGKPAAITLIDSIAAARSDIAATRPTLAVTDLDITPAPPSPSSFAWHTGLTLLPKLTPLGTDHLRSANLVFLQRLAADEAAAAATVWRLSRETSGLLQMMDSDMLAIVGGGADRYVWTSQTSVEHQILGRPTRD